MSKKRLLIKFRNLNTFKRKKNKNMSKTNQNKLKKSKKQNLKKNIFKNQSLSKNKVVKLKHLAVSYAQNV